MHARSCSSAAATSIHVASARARPAWSIRLAGARAEARRRIASSHEQTARDTSSCAALPMHADRCALLCPRASHASASRARARATGHDSSRSAALLVGSARSYSRRPLGRERPLVLEKPRVEAAHDGAPAPAAGDAVRRALAPLPEDDHAAPRIRDGLGRAAVGAQNLLLEGVLVLGDEPVRALLLRVGPRVERVDRTRAWST